MRFVVTFKVEVFSSGQEHTDKIMESMKEIEDIKSVELQDVQYAEEALS